jgi:hypothetical protein
VKLKLHQGRVVSVSKWRKIRLRSERRNGALYWAVESADTPKEKRDYERDQQQAEKESLGLLSVLPETWRD